MFLPQCPECWPQRCVRCPTTWWQPSSAQSISAQNRSSPCFSVACHASHLQIMKLKSSGHSTSNSFTRSEKEDVLCAVCGLGASNISRPWEKSVAVETAVWFLPFREAFSDQYSTFAVCPTSVFLLLFVLFLFF